MAFNTEILYGDVAENETNWIVKNHRRIDCVPFVIHLLNKQSNTLYEYRENQHSEMVKGNFYRWSLAQFGIIDIVVFA